MAKDIEDMNKDELEEFALESLSYSIDKRRRLDDLIEQVKSMAQARSKPKVEEKPKGERTPKRVRNIHTGVEWNWNPLYRGNPDLEIIEWG
jgi:antitoxin component of MazEF toxin-antitoxin module